MKKKKSWMDPETYTGEAVAAAAEKRQKSDRYKYHCQANPKSKGCSPKTMDKRVAKGEGADAGGKARKQILGGELHRYNTSD